MGFTNYEVRSKRVMSFSIDKLCNDSTSGLVPHFLCCRWRSAAPLFSRTLFPLCVLFIDWIQTGGGEEKRVGVNQREKREGNASLLSNAATTASAKFFKTVHNSSDHNNKFALFSGTFPKSVKKGGRETRKKNEGITSVQLLGKVVSTNWISENWMCVET